MIVVAVVGLLTGLVVHVRAVSRDCEEFAYAVLFLEGVGVAIIGATASGIGIVINHVHKDDVYAARLRRREVPARCPIDPADR